MRAHEAKGLGADAERLTENYVGVRLLRDLSATDRACLLDLAVFDWLDDDLVDEVLGTTLGLAATFDHRTYRSAPVPECTDSPPAADELFPRSGPLTTWILRSAGSRRCSRQAGRSNGASRAPCGP